MNKKLILKLQNPINWNGKQIKFLDLNKKSEKFSMQDLENAKNYWKSLDPSRENALDLSSDFDKSYNLILGIFFAGLELQASEMIVGADITRIANIATSIMNGTHIDNDISEYLQQQEKKA